MRKIVYSDFDVAIQRTEEGYRAQVLTSPAGQATAAFTLPFSELELENFLLRVGRPRRGTRRIDSPEVGAAKSFGERLFSAVFNGEVRGCLRSSLDDAARNNAGLRIRMRLTDVPELADLPWEYLYNPSLNRFLALSVETPFVRYLELPESIRAFTVKPPLRVLVMISSPTDYPRLDVEREWTKLQESVADLVSNGVVILERLDTATLSLLQRYLRRGEYHVFHFIGHGGFEQKLQDGVLIFEDDAERGRAVSGQDLGTLLHDHRALRLAILNACEGARTSRADPFAGTAQSLVQQGLPAVIAMQFEITDEAAITFAHEFYAAVADGYPVDAAVAEARKAIFAEGNGLEWGTPVLYLRAADGLVFNVEHGAAKRVESSPGAEPEKRVEPEPSKAPAPQRSLPDAQGTTEERIEETGVGGEIKKKLVAAAALLVMIIAAGILWMRERPVPNPIVSLGVLVPKKELAIRERLALKLTATYADGSTKELAEGVEWKSSNPDVGIVTPAGQFEALTGGSTEITARVGERTSLPLALSVTAQDILKVQLVALAVGAGRTELKPDERLNLSLRARYSDGAQKTVLTGMRWRSSRPAVVAIDAEGEAVAHSEGQADITAEYLGMASPALTLTVKAPEPPPTPVARLVALLLESQARELQISERTRLSVRARYSDGAEKILARGVEWRSSQPQVVVVSAEGLAEAKGQGRAEITASYGGVASTPISLIVREVAKKVTPDNEVKEYLSLAQAYHERGDYARALAYLARAKNLDPGNKEVQSAIELTRRACNAERRLGRIELQC